MALNGDDFETRCLSPGDGSLDLGSCPTPQAQRRDARKYVSWDGVLLGAGHRAMPVGGAHDLNLPGMRLQTNVT
jgi:hypothetical protein